MGTILLGVVTGVATAAVLGTIAWVWRFRSESRVKQLGDLMGEIIVHRNAGRHIVSDPAEWVEKAKGLEQAAEQKAYKVSAASGLLIHWLGELNQIGVDGNVQDQNQRHYVDILTTVISRIRDTLGRHDQ